jgi:hypothetical protein
MIAELPEPLSRGKSPFVVSRAGNLAICNMCKSSPPGAPQLGDVRRDPSRSRRTCGQVYLLGPGLINKAPSPKRSIPPINSSWLDNASMPIWLFNERRLPIKPNKPQTQKRPMRASRPNVNIQRGIVRRGRGGLGALKQKGRA